MTKEQLIQENKTLKKIIRGCLPGLLIAQLHFYKVKVAALEKQIKKART